MNLIKFPNYSRRSVKPINTPVPLPLHAVESGRKKRWTKHVTHRHHAKEFTLLRGIESQGRRIEIGDVSEEFKTKQNSSINCTINRVTKLQKSRCTCSKFFYGSAAQRGLWPCSRGFLITHNDAPKSAGLLWTSHQLVRDLYLPTHTTDKHPYPVCDSNPDRSRQAAVDLRLRPRGHWDRLMQQVPDENFQLQF
jgi:hypothetical protein